MKPQNPSDHIQGLVISNGVDAQSTTMDLISKEKTKNLWLSSIDIPHKNIHKMVLVWGVITTSNEIYYSIG